MRVYGFDKEKSSEGHGGTILAAPVVEGNMKEPFQHAWGYLEGPGTMELHAHPTYEIYIFVEGEGAVIVEDVRTEVKAGDIVNIMPGENHTVINERNSPLKWAAFWWDS